jgi:fructokinase
MQEKLLKTKDYPVDIITFGEVLIDRITDHAHHEHMLVGGSPSNIAINMHQLGARSLFAGAVGSDREGRLILDRFNHYGLSTDYISVVEAPTSIVALEQSSATPVPSFLRGADYHISLNESLLNAVRQTRIFHFSYWPLTRKPALQTLLTCLDEAEKANAVIGFDPNIHVALDHEDMITSEALEALFRRLDFIKPSLDDAKRLWGESNIEAIMDRFESYDIPVIILSLGKDGIYISENKRRTLVPSKPTEVVDTTGAGDAFYSGFYTSLLHGNSLEKAWDDAQAVSALVLNVLGALAPLPHYQELNKGAL